MSDYLPPKRTERAAWLQNLSDQLPTEAPKMGVPAADATAAKALADAILAKMSATDTAETALDGARTVERVTFATNIEALRAKIRNWKTLPGFAASGSEAVLKLAGRASSFDPNTYKATMKAVAEPGQVRISFEKRGVDGVAVYSRLKGTPGWTRIGTDTASPYYDTRPLAAAGTPEVREYKVRGFIDDAELGLESDIVSVTFAG